MSEQSTKHRRRIRISAILVVTLISLMTAKNVDASPDPVPQPTGVAIPSVSSTDQKSGVTAGYVNQLTQTVLPSLVRGPLLNRFKDTFSRGAIILSTAQNPLITDEQITQCGKDAGAWISETYTWLKADVGPYAAERFAFHQPGIINWGIAGTHKDGFVQTRNNIINIMYPLLQNTDLLMREPSIYPSN